MSHKFEKRCEARQNEIRDGSVLAHVTKRIAAITPPRALVVLRFLLNTTEATHCLFPNPITACYLTNYIRSAETGEIFGLGAKDLPGKSQLPFQSLCSRGYKRSTLSVAGFNLAMDMSDQPNLLLLWTDQQRADTLACHGNTTIDAPNLNELTERSLVFEQAYCSQPVCTPSRGTILTGLWPHAHGCLTNNIPLPGERKTIAELVGDEYLCAYYGKWHLGDELVAQHGFEDWVSIEDGIYRPYYSRPEYLRERSSYHKFLVKNGYAPDSRDQRGEPVFSRDFAAAMGENFTKAHFLGQEAARFLRQRKDGRPFVLSVCFLEPHPPVFGPLNHLYDPDEIPVGEAFIRAPDERASRRNRERALDCLRDGFKNYPLDTEWDWRRLLANYCGLVTLVDRAVGEILQALRESGQEDNTVIAYTSDHGEMLGDHALMGKGVFYEESSRIPLFIRVPWIADEGRMINGRISQIDLVPTLLDLMNQPLGEHLQGRSRRPVLEGQETLSDNDVIVEWNSPDGTDQEWRSIFAADGWKLNLCTGDQCELYDLNTDPHELHNRFEEPARRGRIDDLTARIRAWQSTVGDDLPLP